MTPEQLAAFSISNDFYMWAGVILGLTLGGFFKHFLNVLVHRFERPRRIKFTYLNDSEKQDKAQYLYLYNGSYYTLEHRDFLQKERLKKLKYPINFDFIFFLFVCFSLIVSVIYVFFNTDLGFLK